MPNKKDTAAHHLPEEGYVRLPQIIGDPEANIPAVFPVSRPAWYKGVKEGRYPAPVKLSARTAAWRVSDIRKLIENPESFQL